MHPVESDDIVIVGVPTVSKTYGLGRDRRLIEEADRRSRNGAPVMNQRGGFTLVELLVSLAVLGLLVALVVPALASARRRGIEAHCRANMASTAAIVTAYTNDFRDKYPYAGDAPRLGYFVPEGVAWDHPIGGRFGLRAGMWSVLFPEYWSGVWWSPGLRCPRQPRYDPLARTDSPPLELSSLVMPQYWMSGAMWLDASSLDPLDRPYREFRVRSNGVHDVTFPSLKVLLFEQIAFCASSHDQHPWITVGQTPFSPTCVGLTDGSVNRLIRQDGLPAVGSLPFEFTRWGVHGRDIP